MKEFFRNNGYSAAVSSFDYEKADSNTNKTYIRAKKIFSDYWCKNMGGFGGKDSLLNFTNDYPVKTLEKADENYVEDFIFKEVAKIIFDDSNIEALVEDYYKYHNTLPVSILKQEVLKATEETDGGDNQLKFMIKSEPNFIENMIHLNHVDFVSYFVSYAIRFWVKNGYFYSNIAIYDMTRICHKPA